MLIYADNRLRRIQLTNSTPKAFSLLSSAYAPEHYSINLKPDLEKNIFTGDENIQILVTESNNQITLNSTELIIQYASISYEDTKDDIIGDVSYDENAETVTISFPNSIPLGSAELKLRFSGILNDQLHGFYISNYEDLQGNTKKLAVTQFEATDARRCFPCWDEPAIKATFQVSMTVPNELVVVANTMEETRVELDSGMYKVLFKTTPVMSTYLLAFVVGELESIEQTGDNGTLVRVWTTIGQAERGRFALDVAVRLLKYYNGYFGIKYPLEKLDHIAIPDFAAGAMENWGAVTYREVALLFDRESSSPGTRQRITEIIAHEMAHMWFGDLVTMAWWNDLWLNESFASWMATKATDYLYPEWEVWTQFISDDVAPGMGLDGLENSHPIESKVSDPAEVSQLFDAISYSKGASIIRMLEQFIGADEFQRGLYQYLDKHSYSNAEGADLWEAMADSSGQDIPSMMDTWIKQVGYPVLEIKKEKRGSNQDVLVVDQRRFLYSGPNDDESLWHVPLTIINSTNSNVSTELIEDRTTSIPMETKNSWNKINSGTTGFYRVQYSDSELDTLIKAIKNFELKASDRLGLIEDTFALVRGRYIGISKYLDLIKSYQGDQDYSVWAAISGQIASLDRLIIDNRSADKFREFGRSIFSNIVKDVGWNRDENEPHLRSLLRSVVLNGSGYLGDKIVLDEARERFNRFIEDNDTLPPDIRAVVYALAAEGGSESIFEALLKLEKDFKLQEEKVRVQVALTRFRQPDLIRKVLDISLDPAQIRVQDTPRIIMGLAGTPSGLQITWEFMKENWAEFDRRYGGGGFAVMRLVSITGGFNTAQDAVDVKKFFEKNPVPAATRTIEQSLERISLNEKWIMRNEQFLREWDGKS